MPGGCKKKLRNGGNTRRQNRVKTCCTAAQASPNNREKTKTLRFHHATVTSRRGTTSFLSTQTVKNEPLQAGALRKLKSQARLDVKTPFLDEPAALALRLEACSSKAAVQIPSQPTSGFTI